MIAGRVYLEGGKPVLVLAQWNGKGPRNVLIHRPDSNTKVVRPFRGLRRVHPEPVTSVLDTFDRPQAESSWTSRGRFLE